MRKNDIEGLTGVLGKIPGIRNLVIKPVGIRDICDAWQAAGRAGFCNYRFKDVIALLEIEDINNALYAERPPTIPIQIITVGDEKYVSNTRIAELVEQQREHSPVSHCALPEDVPHEMLSPYENPERQMYWLTGLLVGTVEFIVNEKFFASEPDDNGQNNLSLACKLN
jgi:hypothetical protein